MKRHLHLVGLNHRSAAVDVRERYALTRHCDPECWAIPRGEGVEESFILSTCNRVEVLVVGRGEKLVQHALESWATACGRQAAELSGYIYKHQDEDAVRHLFTVASSLDSLVLGEPQILGQLKEAYRQAAEGGKTGPILNRLLHKSFSVAKRVRTETAVASSAVSISYAAVELAKRIFGSMSGYTAMLVGAGEMAELAAMHLLQAGIQRIFVANRTYGRAVELARQFHGEAVAFESLFEHLVETDIVIASTGAPEAVIRAGDIRDVLKKRKHRPMFFIDIAVPRDVAPDVNSLDNVYLYDIDDLKEVVEENLASRRDEAAKARHIVSEEAGSFMHWLDQLRTQPTIVEFIQRGERIVEEELSRTLRRLGPVDGETLDALRAMASAMARKFNHDPIHFLKNGGMEGEAPLERIHLMQRMFRLGDELPLPPRRCGRKG
ncbi:MAG: glutamyl-tRNA reductase [Betaproteobacteria bacterium]|nr:glutamyl-tRNA reductase [Betaproteobacteria bacterium]